MSPFKLQRCVEISKALVSRNAYPKNFHTTFILNKNKIKAVGINTPKTHPRNLQLNHHKDGVDYHSDVGIHSELSAILKYNREDCSDCVFVNVRIDLNGNCVLSKPCVGCQSLLNQVGYKRFYYTDNNGEFVLYEK